MFDSLSSLFVHLYIRPEQCKQASITGMGNRECSMMFVEGGLKVKVIESNIVYQWASTKTTIFNIVLMKQSC